MVRLGSRRQFLVRAPAGRERDLLDRRRQSMRRCPGEESGRAGPRPVVRYRSQSSCRWRAASKSLQHVVDGTCCRGGRLGPDVSASSLNTRFLGVERGDQLVLPVVELRDGDPRSSVRISVRSIRRASACQVPAPRSTARIWVVGRLAAGPRGDEQGAQRLHVQPCACGNRNAQRQLGRYRRKGWGALRVRYGRQFAAKSPPPGSRRARCGAPGPRTSAPRSPCGCPRARCRLPQSRRRSSAFSAPLMARYSLTFLLSGSCRSPGMGIPGHLGRKEDNAHPRCNPGRTETRVYL